VQSQFRRVYDCLISESSMEVMSKPRVACLRKGTEYDMLILICESETVSPLFRKGYEFPIQPVEHTDARGRIGNKSAVITEPPQLLPKVIRQLDAWTHGTAVSMPEGTESVKFDEWRDSMHGEQRRPSTPGLHNPRPELDDRKSDHCAASSAMLNDDSNEVSPKLIANGVG
jgi:hypothetical protein